MEQKFIIGDFVMYDNKIMLIKEPRDGSHFDLSCPTEGLVYCLVNIDEIKPIPITVEILKKNGWKKEKYHDWYYLPLERTLLYIVEGTGIDGAWSVCVGLNMSNIASISFVHQLQHLLFGLELNSEMEV